MDCGKAVSGGTPCHVPPTVLICVVAQLLPTFYPLSPVLCLLFPPQLRYGLTATLTLGQSVPVHDNHTGTRINPEHDCLHSCVVWLGTGRAGVKRLGRSRHWKMQAVFQLFLSRISSSNTHDLNLSLSLRFVFGPTCRCLLCSRHFFQPLFSLHSHYSTTLHYRSVVAPTAVCGMTRCAGALPPSRAHFSTSLQLRGAGARVALCAPPNIGSRWLQLVAGRLKGCKQAAPAAVAYEAPVGDMLSPCTAAVTNAAMHLSIRHGMTPAVCVRLCRCVCWKWWYDWASVLISLWEWCELYITVGWLIGWLAGWLGLNGLVPPLVLLLF